jgi:hypothetical protein
VPAHQPVVDRPACAVGPEQPGVAARVGHRPAAVVELAVDDGVGCVAERDGVAPGVRPDEVAGGHGPLDEARAGVVDQVAPDDEEQGRRAVAVEDLEDVFGDAGGRSVVDREGQPGRHRDVCGSAGQR